MQSLFPWEFQFLSTLSLRRATTILHRHGRGHRDFYPRSPCGERRLQIIFDEKPDEISIHALLAESDIMGLTGLMLCSRFLSTLSLRRATVNGMDNANDLKISIHALLAESDISSILRQPVLNHFYPRSPCGERPVVVSGFSQFQNFYPRSPCGERLKRLLQEWLTVMDFYPRSPCGERPRAAEGMMP